VLEAAETAGESSDDDAAIDAKVQQMTAARAAKDFAASDAIRDELTAAGVEVQISKQGITWRRKMTLD
jgi:cysteinyl-tRNA synthetase